MHSQEPSPTADFDLGIDEWRRRLQAAAAGSLDRIAALIALGELHGNASNEALQFLHAAEGELQPEKEYPSDSALVGALGETVTAIQSGQAVVGCTTLEAAFKKRALAQRLWLALSNAYRATHPDRAAHYEQLLRRCESKVFDMRRMLVEYLDLDTAARNR